MAKRQGAKAHGTTRLTQVHRTPLRVPHASGIAGLTDGSFLVVDDENGLYAADEGGDAEPLASAKEHACLRDLEGIGIDRHHERVIVVGEKGGSVSALPLGWKGKAPALGMPEALGRLPRIGKVDNKGWEGITWIPGGVLGEGERLLAVHEGKPRRIGVFSYPHLEVIHTLKLPRTAKDALLDLSDVEVDVERRRILVLSDESRTVVSFAVAGLDADAPSLEVAALFEVPAGKGEKPEGLCIAGGRLWVVTDGVPFLYAFELPES